MTKKTYVALAKDFGMFFRDYPKIGKIETICIINILCGNLSRDNPRFSPSRFREAIQEAKEEEEEDEKFSREMKKMKSLNLELRV